MIVIQDTREKRPWTFDFYDEVQDVEIQKLDVGDYTVKGLEDKLAIERKATTGEIALNLGTLYKKFQAELERGKDLRWMYVICEFPVSHVLSFPLNSSIPKKNWRKLEMNGKALMAKLTAIQNEYGVQVIYSRSKEHACEQAVILMTECLQEIRDEQENDF